MTTSIDQPERPVLGRRGFLALVSTPVLVALLDACSSESGSPTSASSGNSISTGTDGATLLRSQLALTPSAVADALEAAASVDDFGMEMYRWLATVQPGDNLVFSPASIATALTMVTVGAAGTTLDELVAVLHIESPDTIHHAMNALTAELGRRSSGEVTLAIENSLWVQVGLDIEQRFLDLLGTEYDAGVHLVDFAAQTEAARAAINGWVGDHTEGRIPELLAPGVLTANSRLALVNAVYLKAPWLQTFDPSITVSAPFTTTDGSTVQVPMMTMSGFVPYATGDGWQAVELAYDTENLTMIVFLPEPETLGQFEQIFVLADATPYLSPTEMVVQIPKFDIGFALSLADILRAMGVVTAFGDDADLSGITTEERLRISAVVHQANISVDEGGTEAAAATAVIGGVGAAPGDDSDPVTFRADRPFVFAIRDRGTEAILFLGRVGKPA